MALLAIDGQGALLIELLFEYLVLGAQLFADLLLMPIDPAGEDEERQLPGLQNSLHISPDVV